MDDAELFMAAVREPTFIKVTGQVTTGDEYRCADEESERGALFIGGIDLIKAIGEKNFRHPVTVGVADERFMGPLSIEFGWGYSEWTPMDPDTLSVGEHNLIEILKRYEGQTITVWVSDQPINLLE